MSVPAKPIHDDFLAPVLESIAADDIERALIANHATPEADSLAELLVEQMALTDRICRLLCELAHHNGIALHFSRRAAGFADRLYTELADIEHNSGQGNALTARKIATRINACLDALADRDLSSHHPAFREQLDGLFSLVPESMVFRPAVLYHVGTGRLAALKAEHKRWGAAR